MPPRALGSSATDDAIAEELGRDRDAFVTVLPEKGPPAEASDAYVTLKSMRLEEIHWFLALYAYREGDRDTAIAEARTAIEEMRDVSDRPVDSLDRRGWLRDVMDRLEGRVGRN